MNSAPSAQARRDPRRASGSVERHRGAAPYLFVAPYVSVALLFTLYPLVKAVVLAFYQTNGPASRTFIGLDNFRYLFGDPVFLKALQNTTVFTLCSVFLQLPLAMGLALLLNSGKGKSKALFRLILFSPNLVGQVFVGILFAVMFAPRLGLINRFLQALLGFGLERRWLSDPAMVMPAIVITSLWIWVGFNMIYFLAALQSVDRSLVEAARIDGATRLQVFRYVMLPSMRHVVLFVLITCISGSFQLFELPLALIPENNGRGPDDSALTVVGYLYEVGFNAGDLGLGSAVGWLVAVIIFALSLLQIRISRVAED